MPFLERPHHCTPLRWCARRVDGRSPWFFRGWPTHASPLWIAASANLLEIATYLIAQGASPNSSEFEYVSALGVASYYGHIDMVRILIAAGARPNAAGVDPLQLACARHHVDIVQMLIEKKFDVNAAGGLYPSPLESVAPTGSSWRIGHPEIEKLLRDAGAHRRETGMKGLQIASENGQVEMVSYLLKDGGRDKGGTALEAAARRGHIDVAKMFLDKVVDLEAVPRSRALRAALEATSTGGYIDITRMVLDKIAELDVVSDYSGALEAAASNGHTTIVGLLLERGAEINDSPRKTSTALEAASSEGHVDLAKMLLDKAADLDAVCRIFSGALEAASTRGHIDIARIVLDKAADLDAVSNYSGALRAAAIYGDVAIVSLLLERGAEVDNRPWETVSSSLENAVERGHADIVRLLLGRQAKFDDQLLRVAVTGGFVDIVDSLLKAGADPNEADGYLQDSLETAVNAGNKYIVQMLLDHGAMPRPWRRFKDPLVVAARKGNLDIVQLLLQRRADLYETTSVSFNRVVRAAGSGGNEAIARDVLAQGASPNKMGFEYISALGVALYGYVEIV
ncbi:ankyrin repeat-containing domain protein [Mycena leptocephala]|nr:ankyrin repeat-containing domain protein [Mycena leptocephala]